MSSASLSEGALGRPNRGRQDNARALAPIAAIFALSVFEQCRWLVNADTSWNITLAERVLDGQRPNIDFIEINPPLSFLLYLPATLAARLTGARPEFTVNLFCFVCIGLSLWLSGSILQRSSVFRQGERSRFILAAAAVLLLLPGRHFNEREHIALIAALPCLAALAAWAARGGVAPALSLLAGLSAGFAIAIKPHFALFFIPNLAYLAWRAGLRSLLGRVELWAALAMFALYWGAIFLWFPAFFERALPIARDIYVPYRRPFQLLTHDPTFLSWIVLGVLLAIAARKRWSEPLVAVPALASLGAAAAYLIQGKFWPYQGYPAVALVALPQIALVLESLSSPGAFLGAPVRVAVALFSALTLSIAGFWFSVGGDKAQLERAVAAIGPHPRIIAISPDIATGHPLTRRVDGVWVGSLMSLWITQMSRAALKRDPGEDAARRYENYMSFDRQTLVSDIVKNKPDVILIPNEAWRAWAMENADVAEALANYHLRETADDVMVYERNDGGR